MYLHMKGRREKKWETYPDGVCIGKEEKKPVMSCVSVHPRTQYTRTHTRGTQAGREIGLNLII